MLIREVMNREIKTLTLNCTLREAVQIFQYDKIGIIPVVDAKDNLLGAFSRYSLFRALLNDCPLDTFIHSYVIKDAVTIYEDMLVSDVAKLLKELHVAHAIVISHDNRFLGVLGQADIIRTALLKYNNVANSLNSLLKHMKTGAIAIDQNGKIVVMNPAAEIMCGRSSQSSIGSSLSELYPELQNILSSIELHTEEPLLRQVTIQNKKLLVSANILYNEVHSWVGLLLLQDLIDYERIAGEFESTKKLEQTLQTVVGVANDAYVVIDQQGKVLLVNQSACELKRLSKENINNRSINESFPELRLEEALKDEFPNESVEAVKIGKYNCLLSRKTVRQGNKIVGAIGKITYRNINKLKNVMNKVANLEKEVSYYKSELSLLNNVDFDLDDILSKNKTMKQLKKVARQAALGFSNVLLLGESGTGKELFARGIHNASNRSGNFIKINCAAVPLELWESEFFGYEDGAFTGAKRGGKIGKFEAANNGTVFLDEIGDMPLNMQVKLLRVLQEREFERLGGNQTIRVNVRIIAATNKDLEQMVALGEFREDLYYRLNVIALHITPLRNRIEDIPLLVNSIFKKFSQTFGIDSISISPTAMSLLVSHKWPGNVRELENIIERAITYMNGNKIEANHLPDYLRQVNTENKKELVNALLIPAQTSEIIENTQDNTVYFRKKVSEAEKEAVMSALQMANGNRTTAAKLLGISRSQLYNKLKKFNVN